MMNIKLKILKLLTVILLFSNFSSCNEKTIIGLLTTNTPIYDHETYFSEAFYKVIDKFNADLYVIDYHQIYSRYLTSKTSEPLSNILINELEKNNIKKVIIPGNWYNFDTPPYAPLPNRQRVTETLLQLSKEGKVTLLGICGGMQAVLHADGIKLVNLFRMGAEHDHLKSYPGPYAENIKLNRIMVNPANNLAKIIRNDKLHVTNNGWIILNLPDYHTETVSLEKSNLEALSEKGYKIVGFDNHGIIEILEDKYGNTYFQSHPEGLILHHGNQENYNSQSVGGSIAGIYQFFKYFTED